MRSNFTNGIIEGAYKGFYLPGYVLKNLGVTDTSFTEDMDKLNLFRGRKFAPEDVRTSISYQVGSGIGLTIFGIISLVPNFGAISVLDEYFVNNTKTEDAIEGLETRL